MKKLSLFILSFALGLFAPLGAVEKIDKNLTQESKKVPFTSLKKFFTNNSAETQALLNELGEFIPSNMVNSEHLINLRVVGPESLYEKIYKKNSGKTRTSTVIGRISLMHLLTNPTNNRDLLEARQKLVNTLLAKEKRKAARAICSRFAKYEDLLYPLLNTTELQQIFSDHCLPPAKLTSSWSTSLLTAQRAVRILGNYTGATASIAKNAALGPLFNGLLYTSVETQGIRPAQACLNFSKSLTQKFINAELDAIPGCCAILALRKGNNTEASIHALSQVYLCYGNNTYWGSGIGKAEAQIIQLLESIAKLNNKTSISNSLENFPILSEAEKKIVETFLTELNETLDSNWILRTSRLVQLFWKHALAIESKNPFRLLIKYIGDLDAFSAFARYFRKLSTCTVSFDDNKEAKIEIKNSYNPLIDYPVKNDISFKKEMHNMLLVAPNSTGKSAFVEMIITNVLMAHVTGYCFADTCSLSIFDEIWAYKKVDEDMASGTSTGQAQVISIAKLNNDIQQATNGGKKVLFVGDEVASGLPEKGAQDMLGAKNGLFDTLNKSETICSIIITHFNLHNLVDEKFKTFKHFHMAIAEPTLGEFIPKFKLDTGKDFWLSKEKADEEQRKRFSTWYLILNAES